MILTSPTTFCTADTSPFARWLPKNPVQLLKYILSFQKPSMIHFLILSICPCPAAQGTYCSYVAERMHAVQKP